MIITDVKESEVTFARLTEKGRASSKGRCWLPIDYVREHGRWIRYT